nr:hypothetical protein [Tanacetum cinerariifolium]
MTSKAQQSAIDNALVAQGNQCVIGKYNMRINPRMKPKESTYQVMLDAFALTACYLTFLITAKVPVIYMHQDILNICPRILGQEFNESLTKEEALSFIHKLGHSGEIKYITDVIVDHLHQPWRNFASTINKCLCGKKKPTKSKKDVTSKKNPASKPKPTKKKAPIEADRGDGTDFELRVPDEQQRKTSSADEGTDTKPRVLDAPKYLFESENESWGDSSDDESNNDNSDEVTKNDDEYDVKSDANDDNEASDSEKTDSDKDENLNLNLNDDEEEEKEEDVRTLDSLEFNDDDEEYDEFYKDVNVRSKVVEHEEAGKGDKTKGSKQSSFVSSDFTSKFFNLDNVSPIIDEVASMMNVKTFHEELSTQAPPDLLVPMTSIPEASTVHVTTVTLIIQPFSSIPQMTTQLLDLYDAPFNSYQLDKDLFDSYGKTYSLRRGYEDKDKDEDPPAGSDQGLKKRKTNKDVEPSRGSRLKESKSSSSKGLKPQSKTSDKSAQAEEPVLETVDSEMPQDQEDNIGNTEDQPNVKEDSKHDCKMAKSGKPPTTFDELMSTRIDFSAYVLHNLKTGNLTQEHLVGPAFNLLKGTCKSRVKLEFHFEECYKAVTDKLDWTNPEGHEYLFDLKTKAVKYDTIEGIKDMAPLLWSPVKSLKEEMHEMRKNYNNLREKHAFKNHMNDDTLVCERHEVNFIKLEELNSDVKNDLEDFKRAKQYAILSAVCNMQLFV